MALINLNIDTFKKDAGGVLNKLVNNVTNQIENKLENAVEDLIGGALKKVGLSSSIAGEISARFGDAFSKGAADKYFGEFTSEMNRATPQDIKSNLLPAGDAETYVDAITRATNTLQSRDGAPTLQYPSQITKYYMSMKFATYQRPSPEARANLDFKQAIILPLPRELREQIAVNVDEQSQGMAGGIADAVAIAGTSGVGTALDQTGGALLYSTLVTAVEGLSKEAGQVLGQFAGAVPNPHAQAIFSGIPLRTHRFDWTFAPRNKEESGLLQKLVMALKAYSLPSYSRLGTAALQYPMLCQLDLYPWASAEYGEPLIRFTPAILKNVDINYAPQGMPAFFEGTNLPTMISLGLEFIESEIHTGNTYGRQGDDNVTKLLEKGAAAIKDAYGVDLNEKRREIRDALNGE